MQQGVFEHLAQLLGGTSTQDRPQKKFGIIEMAITTVYKLKELKAALSRDDVIIIADPKIATSVRIVKAASVPVLTAAVALAGVAATNFWNPIGWGANALVVTTEGALVASVTFLLVSLGVGILWALYYRWDVDATGEVTLPNGAAIKGGLKLKPKATTK